MLPRTQSKWDLSAVKIESNYDIATTGGTTWPAARRLANFIEAEQSRLHINVKRPINILELGSGTGWLGLTLALHLSATLLLTEQEDGMNHLRNNVELNMDAATNVSVMPCDWREYASEREPPIGHLAPMNNRPWDLIIGSDLIYVEEGAINLPKVIAKTATQGITQVLYSHTKHRFDNLDLRLDEEMTKNGLIMREIIEEGSELPPPSPPPLTELFPKTRIAIYEIRSITLG